MAKTGRFIHESVSNADVAVGTNFNANNRHDIVTGGGRFEGSLDGIVIRVKAINQATKVTIKVCHTTAGTGVVIPDTEAVIALEVGSQTNGGCAYQMNFSHVHTDDDFSIFYKCDAGSCTIDLVELYWRE